jgi:type III pantothenate kinase
MTRRTSASSTPPDARARNDTGTAGLTTLMLSVGNSSLYGGVDSAVRPMTTFRLPSADLMRLPRYISPRIDRAVVCSVVPAQTPDVLRFIRRIWNLEASVLSSDSPHGLKIGYRRPQLLGTDRIATALGAQTAHPGRNCIVVDFGTATTLTALRKDGRILGGAILPGLSLWSEMLTERTAQLPIVELDEPKAALGRSPHEAISSGIFFGHAGAVRECLARIQKEAFGRARCIIIATGGHAARFAGQKLFTEIEPGLILKGLRTFADRIDNV